jgi:hypothetical protein
LGSVFTNLSAFPTWVNRFFFPGGHPGVQGHPAFREGEEGVYVQLDDAIMVAHEL